MKIPNYSFTYWFKSEIGVLYILRLIISMAVENAYSITVSLTRFYPGPTQILLTINVNTRLQSHELSTPLPLGATTNTSN